MDLDLSPSSLGSGSEMLLLDSVFCFYGFTWCFTCGSGKIWAKLLLDKMKM